LKMDKLEQKRYMRTGQPFQFVWPVDLKHAWIEAKPLEDPSSKTDAHLVALSDKPAKRSKPLESATGLFREFAQLRETQAAALNFANLYGMLSDGSWVVPTTSPKVRVVSIGTVITGKKQTTVIPGAEPHGFWVRQIRAMHRAVELWDAVRSNDRQHALAGFIEWRDRSSVMYRSRDGAKEWIASTVHHPELLSTLRYLDLVQPARYQLQRLVNGGLREFTSCPQLLWDNGDMFLFIQPRSLLGAMWLQFARAIDGDREYRVCPGCDRWFEIGGGQRRADAKACSGTCRQRISRAAKEEKNK
jgi:hypothetical protein